MIKSYTYPIVNFKAGYFFGDNKYGFVNVRTARLIKNFLKITFKVMSKRIVNVIRISSTVYIINNRNLEICCCKIRKSNGPSKFFLSIVEKSD